MSKIYRNLFASVCCVSILSFVAPLTARAETCTSTLPDTNCSLDEDTVAPLTIDGAVTLSVNGDVNLNHAIDGSSDGVGTVRTSNAGVSVQQNAAIGSNNSIDALVIGTGDSWTATADIITNNDGTDIDLGVGSAGEVLTLNGGLTFEGQIDGNAGDTVNIGLDGNGGSFQGNGTIESVNVNVVSGTFDANSSLGSTFALNSASVADGARLNLNSNGIVDGDFDLDGTVFISAGNSLRVDSVVSDADNGDIILGIDRASDSTTTGSFRVLTGGPIDLSAENLLFDFSENAESIDTQTLQDVIQGNGGVTVGPTINDQSYLYDFALTDDGSSNLDLTITRNDLNASTNNSNNRKIANHLFNDLALADSSDLKAFRARLSEAPTESAFNETLESAQPILDGSNNFVATQVGTEAMNIARRRLSNLNSPRQKQYLAYNKSKIGEADKTKYAYRVKQVTQDTEQKRYSYPDATTNTDTNSGVVVPNRTRALAERRLRYLQQREAVTQEVEQRVERIKKMESDFADNRPVYKTGQYSKENPVKNYQVWAQPYVVSGGQDTRSTVNGYDFTSTGLTAGIDSGHVHGNAVVGAMVGYASSDVESDNANQAQTDITTYQVGAYGSYEINHEDYVSGSVVYGLNDVETQRFNVGGGSATASARYDTHYVGAHAEYGRRLVMKDSNITVTPSMGAQYNLSESEGYSETGAGGLNASVDGESVSSLYIGPKVEVSTVHQTENGVLVTPRASAGYGYDVIGEDVSVTSGLEGTDIGGGATQINLEGVEAQRHNAQIETGVSMEKGDWQVDLDYNFDWKNDYSSHTGAVKVNYKF